MNPKYLVVSRHDFRSPRKADIHFLSAEIAKRGETRFFSVGFSTLSKYNQDPRLSLNDRANRIEEFNKVQCFLWKTNIHPFNIPFKLLSMVEGAIFEIYLKLLPPLFFEWVKDSKYVVLESGLPVIFAAIVKKANPQVKIIYTASDDVETIGCARYITRKLDASADQFDWIRVTSRKLADKFQRGKMVCYIPHGIDLNMGDYADPNPYDDRLNAVSVGSMLFDAKFIVAAAQAFPSMLFHIIGGGKAAENLTGENIKIYPEMPFKETLPYLKYADIGLAPYLGEKVHPYLADTSLKLAQYAFFRIPAVCPDAAVGDHAGRFGYDPVNQTSIVSAISAALRSEKVNPVQTLAWADVADRFLSPYDFPETIIDFKEAKQMHGRGVMNFA
jgi:2-beta-glucuronyltransferase